MINNAVIGENVATLKWHSVYCRHRVSLKVHCQECWQENHKEYKMADNQRLADMKQFLAMEKADPDGSKLYIADLEASIESLEKRMASDSKFVIMNTHSV